MTNINIELNDNQILSIIQQRILSDADGSFETELRSTLKNIGIENVDIEYATEIKNSKVPQHQRIGSYVLKFYPGNSDVLTIYSQHLLSTNYYHNHLGLGSTESLKDQPELKNLVIEINNLSPIDYIISIRNNEIVIKKHTAFDWDNLPEHIINKLDMFSGIAK